ncbi:MAG: RidA family protein [Armatimonadota bacterium]|nr:RidA family protein [Armatimonadota bacterium]MDR7440139.1 RidA family protein [Armatimonadota bacterium]MDR7562931.1 RidA family protein [Armatimonadota bacterium]MDR7568000.1 RidA family protein [Armatimonadota bacterium]MDR7601431.1 RidA family protein [Armatimonadota bacterium]
MGERRIINPPSLPAPRGYSHGVLVRGGDLLFLGGQDGSDPQGRLAPDLVGQFRQALANLQAVVEAAGGTLQDVVKLNIFVRDRVAYLEHRRSLGEVFRAFFGGYYPALALFEVTGFFREEALVEIEGIAVIPRKEG